LEFNQRAFEKLEGLRGTMQQASGAKGAGGEGEGLEGQVEGILQQMRDLTICASA
jgi:hypothetical protein